MRLTNYRILNVTAIIALLLLSLGNTWQPVLAADSDPDKPGEITSRQFRTIYDQTNEKTASEKEAYGGDVYGLGWYERPFDQSMGYLPFIDISEVRLHREDANWIYLQIFVASKIEDGAELNPSYGIELDTDLDNRGEYLLLASGARGTEWSTSGVVIFTNSDQLMGGANPVLVDKSKPDNKGYDKEIYNSGQGVYSNIAWARISPSNPKCMEIALKNTFVGGIKGKFLWFPWTMVGMKDLSKFEFNDHFSLAEAGSPTREKAELVNLNGFRVMTTSGDEYPLKGVWGVDNTPRYPSGFTPNGQMPGMGQSYEPPPVPHRSSQPTSAPPPA